MDMRIADDAMEVYNCIRTKSEASFTVIRKGEPDPVILEHDSHMATALMPKPGGRMLSLFYKTVSIFFVKPAFLRYIPVN
jgi:hypothetical protein